MFWNNEYTPSPTIAACLAKENISLKELLEDHDILQEYKSQNKSLVQFFNRDEVLEELVELITTEPPTDVPEALRFKYSNVACEILTANTPTLVGRFVERQNILQKLYAFLEQDPPLNPLLSSFFSKTFGILISRNPEQDWFFYQCVCLQVLEFIKTRDGFLNSIYKHIGTPAIMDLLFHIITNVNGPEPKNALFEWLQEQELILRLIDILGNDCDSEKHNNTAQLICDLITTGRTERQNVLQESGNVTGDVLINTLEDENTTKYLLDIILSDSSTESSIISGIKILLKLLENPIINEPVSDTALQFLRDAETDHHRKVIGNILQQIAPQIEKFHSILLNPPQKKDIQTTVTLLSPPFGITRLSVCTLFTVLIETKNPLIIQSICETDFFNTLLKLFKQYCWNNILHNQVRKCVMCAIDAFDCQKSDLGTSELKLSALQKHIIVNCKIVSKLIDCWMHNKNETESTNKKKGCRLGYMGHLIEMLALLVTNMSANEEFSALVESNIDDVQHQEQWNIIVNHENGELGKQLLMQKSFLAGIDPAQSISYLQKDFQDDAIINDYNNEIESNMQNSIDDLANSLYQSELFEEACNSRAFNSFNLDDDDLIWDVVGSNDLANDLQNNLNLASSQSNEPMQIFNRWDIQNNMSAINDTEWATFSIDNFADFDQHFDGFQMSGQNATSNVTIQTINGDSVLSDDCKTNDINGEIESSIKSNGTDITDVTAQCNNSTNENQSSAISNDADDAFFISDTTTVVHGTMTKSDDNANIRTTNTTDSSATITVDDIIKETENLNLINSIDTNQQQSSTEEEDEQQQQQQQQQKQESSLSNGIFTDNVAATNANDNHKSVWEDDNFDTAFDNIGSQTLTTDIKSIAKEKLIEQQQPQTKPPLDLKIISIETNVPSASTNSNNINLLEQQQTNGPA